MTDSLLCWDRMEGTATRPNIAIPTTHNPHTWAPSIPWASCLSYTEADAQDGPAPEAATRTPSQGETAKNLTAQPERQLSSVALRVLSPDPLGISETLSGSPRGQNNLHHNIKMSYAFFAMLTLALWAKLLVPNSRKQGPSSSVLAAVFPHCHAVSVWDKEEETRKQDTGNEPRECSRGSSKGY